jgi:hypothetical protein
MATNAPPDHFTLHAELCRTWQSRQRVAEQQTGAEP